MFNKGLKSLKKQYRELRTLFAPHPLFRVVDKIKLSKLKKGTDKKGYITLKPKGFKHSLKIRKNYTDREVIHYVLQDQYHLPPKTSKLSDNPVIVDLGSNIGVSIAHMKHVYPNAKIIGYEMNIDNFKLAERNIKFYDNVSVNNNAVWIDNSTVTYKDNSGYDSYSITTDLDDKNDHQTRKEVQAITMASIIKNNNLDQIDYIKMDIEGAEEAILKADDLSWMNKVNAMNIEMHLDDKKDIFNYIKIIENKGFNAWKDDKHWSSIFVVRKDI